MGTSSMNETPSSTEMVNATVEPVTETESAPAIVDKRRNFRLLEDVDAEAYRPGAVDFADTETYQKNPNRLSTTRFPLGEEPWPDVEGTDKDSPWTNVKLDVTEHPDPDPDEKHLLHGGAELVLNCFHCNQPLHIGAVAKAKDVLEKGGYRLNDAVKNQDAEVVACVCPNGHVTQFRGDMIHGLIKR